jgi:NADH dehydrogenase [ubiquinone] 1 alpha subcomplex assembly factor 5
MHNIEIFDRQARRKVRDRVARYSSPERWILQRMADSICERLEDLKVQPTRALVIGLGAADIIIDHLKSLNIRSVACDSGFLFAKQFGGIQCDEDRLPFRDGAFDLVICCGVLDTVNDIPGALILARRILQPNAPFIASFLGNSSLPAFKAAILKAQGGVARTHPLLDVRTAGDLAQRAGFSMPVVDQDRIDVHFSKLSNLVSDVRRNGFQNCLLIKHPLTRSEWTAVFDSLPERFPEVFTSINLFAWSPAPKELRSTGPKRSIRSIRE